MNLITTCPSCLSQYSVSPETLRIADGWVGCGQCGYVYDATKTLKNVPVLRQESPNSSPEITPSNAALVEPVAEAAPSTLASVDEQLTVLLAQAEPAPSPQLSQESTADNLVAMDEPDDQSLAAEAPSDTPTAFSKPVLSVALREAMEVQQPATDRASEPTLSEDPPTPSHPPTEPLLRLDAESPPAFGTDTPSPAQLQAMRHEIDPSVQSPQPSARFDPWPDDEDDQAWPKRKQATDTADKKKDLTMVHSVLLSFLVVAMIFQIMLYYRDFLSSSIPALRPALQQACVVLRCKVHSWRNIDAVVIQHASLTQNDAGYYKMNLAVKNNADQKVAMPSVELSLLDANGTIMLRRVLSPEDLRAPEILASEKVWEGEWMIQIAVPLPLSNYKIQVLYP